MSRTSRKRRAESSHFFEDGFDENFIGDEDDRHYVESLTQIDRESLIYERQEKRREAQERREAEQRAALSSSAADERKGAKAHSSSRYVRSSAAPKLTARQHEALLIKQTQEERAQTGQAEQEEKEAKGEEEGEASLVKSRLRSSNSKNALNAAPEALADIRARRARKASMKQSDAFVTSLEVETDEEFHETPKMSRGKGAHREKSGLARDGRDDQAQALENSTESGMHESATGTRVGVLESSENDGDYVHPKNHFSVIGDKKPLKLGDLLKIQLRRDRLEQVMDEPYFADVVKGMFVRVTVGTNTQTNQQRYRVGEVLDVKPMKKYSMPASANKPKRDLNMGLLLQRAASTRLFPLSAVSNHSITEEEFNEFVDSQNGKHLMAEDVVVRVKTAEHKRNTYSYTPEIVQQMLETRTHTNQSANLTVQRNELSYKLKQVQSSARKLSGQVHKLLRGNETFLSSVKKNQETDLLDLVTDLELIVQNKNSNLQKELNMGADDSKSTIEELIDDCKKVISSETRITTRLIEITGLESKAKSALAARMKGTTSSIAAVNARNANEDIDAARQMYLTQDKERREQQQEIKNGGKRRFQQLDPFKRRATRPSNYMQDDDDARLQELEQAASLEEETKEGQSVSSPSVVHMFDVNGLPELKDIVYTPNSRPTRDGAQCIFNIPHPPGVCEQHAQLLHVLHSKSLEGADVMKLFKANPDVVQRNSRHRLYAQTDSSVWIPFFNPATDVNALTIEQYWQQRDA